MAAQKFNDPLNRVAVRALKEMDLQPLQYHPDQAPVLVLLEEALDRWGHEIQPELLDEIQEVVSVDLPRLAPESVAGRIGQPAVPLKEMGAKEVAMAVVEQLHGRLGEERGGYPPRASLPGETRLEG